MRAFSQAWEVGYCCGIEWLGESDVNSSVQVMVVCEGR